MKVGIWGSLFRTLRYFFFFNQIHILRIVDFAAVGGSLQIAAKGTDFELASHVQIVG